MKSSALILLSVAACAAEEPIDPATCEARTYRIDSVELPTSNLEVRQLGHDLDGDEVVDNQLGQVWAMLHRMFAEVPLDLEGAAAEHLATDTDWRITTWHCDGVARLGALTEGAPVEPTLEGESTSGTIVLRGTAEGVPLTSLFDATSTTAPIFMPAALAHVSIAEAGEDELAATVGVALEGEQQRDLVVQAMALWLNLHLEIGRDEIDTDRDGRLSRAEIAASGVVQAVLAPDLVIDGTDAMSLGLRVHATRVR